jgi:hypothetical protein
MTRISIVPIASLVPERSRYARLSVYMLALIQNPHNLSRIRALERYWGFDFRHLSPGSIYRVGAINSSRRPSPLPGVVFTLLPDSTTWPLHELFEAHMRAFLETTECRWFARTTEDCWVDVRKLPVLVRDLERRFDPIRDPAIFGQWVDINLDISMIHGGAGWLMSRAACRLYSMHASEINSRWADEGGGDDLIPHFFRLVANLTRQTAHPAFIGTPLDDDSVDRLTKMHFLGIKACPTAVRQGQTGRFLVPIEPVVFWHSGRNDLFPMNDGYRIARDLPTGLAVAHVFKAGTLCNTTMTPTPEDDVKWM